jgi:hypothetical protein
MAFKKTSISVTPPKQVDLPLPQIGEEKDGLVWDGEQWIPKAEWEAAQAGDARPSES